MIKGFTILEMLIGMALMSILFAAGFYSYQLINLQFSLLQENQEKVMNYQSFLKLFNKDFRQADYVYQVDQKVHLVHNNREKIYYFKDSLTYRKQENKVDTFPIQCIALKPYFLEAKNKITLAKKIELKIFIFGKEEKFIYSKKYSSENYINVEEFRPVNEN